MTAPKVFVSWSGGKDSCLAAYQAVANGLRVQCLLNMVTEDGKLSWTHGLSSALLKMQSRAIRVPLVQKRARQANYETAFRDVLLRLTQDGVSGGVFGDIDLEEHRGWVNSMCRHAGIKPYLPLWGWSQEVVLRDFVRLGFKAVVVAARADLFGKEWLGRRVDLGFIDELVKIGKRKPVTLCGEVGEYHTLVTDGPLFNQRLEVLEANKVLRGGYWFLEVMRCSLQPKG